MMGDTQVAMEERLLAMYSHRGDGLPTQYVNPDGPDAVEEIASLRARVAVLEGALAEIAHNDPLDPWSVARQALTLQGRKGNG